MGANGKTAEDLFSANGLGQKGDKTFLSARREPLLGKKNDPS